MRLELDLLPAGSVLSSTECLHHIYMYTGIISHYTTNNCHNNTLDTTIQRHVGSEELLAFKLQCSSKIHVFRMVLHLHASNSRTYLQVSKFAVSVCQ